jgi:hypothetical protein
MPDNPNSYSDKLAANIAAQIAFAREAVARSRAIVTTPLADSFLGRKTQEPFPKERRPLSRRS